MRDDWVNLKYTGQKSRKEVLGNDFEGYLRRRKKKSIDINKNVHPTGNLTTTFIKPAVEENPYIQFAYGPHTIFNNTQGKVVASIKYDVTNNNKQVNNKHR